MRYLLDTNAWIAAMRGTSKSIQRELTSRPASDIVLCSVVLAELWFGVCRGHLAHRLKNEVLVQQLRGAYLSVPFDDAAALDCAELRATLTAAGNMIGPYDIMIAAIVRRHGLHAQGFAEFEWLRSNSIAAGRRDIFCPEAGASAVRRASDRD